MRNTKSLERGSTIAIWSPYDNPHIEKLRSLLIEEALHPLDFRKNSVGARILRMSPREYREFVKSLLFLTKREQIESIVDKILARS